MNTDTPETDHLENNLGNAAHPVLSSFCRKLERERDEAREVARAWRENWRNGASMSMIASSKLPWENAKSAATGGEGLGAMNCPASSCGNIWVIQIGNTVEIVRRKVLTATEPSLTREESLIGALCEKIIQQNVDVMAAADNKTPTKG